MVRYFYCFLISLFCFFNFSCTRVLPELKTAEELMETAPDSALYILQKLKCTKIYSRYNRALYALLLSQALDKKEIYVGSDSLITVATDYFDESDPEHAGYAWLYHSHTANNRDSVNEQARNLFKAQEYAEKTNDFKLLGLIYGDKGNLYASQRQFDSAICYYKKAYYSFKINKDYRNSIISSLSVAYEFVRKTQFDSALYYYHLAEKLSYHTNEKVIISLIYREMGVTYYQQGNYQIALQKYRKVPLTDNKIYDSNKYYLIGNLFVKTGQPDSAAFYLRKVTELGTMASDYYRLWQKIAEQKGDKILALSYANKVSIATDSLYKKKLETSFAGLEKKFKYQGLQIANQDLTIKNKQKGIFLLVLLLAMCIFSVAFLFWRLRIKKNEVDYQRALLEKEIEKAANEKENNALLERQLKLQTILLSNIKMHQTNTVKRPTVWREGSKETIEKQNETFYNELKTYVDMEYNNFTSRLKEKHPALTDNDIFISCLLLAEFDSGMIATILNVQTESINKARYRLRTKLKLQNSENLTDYLLHFQPLN